MNIEQIDLNKSIIININFKLGRNQWTIAVEEKFCCNHGTCWTEQGSITLKEKLVEYSFGAMMKKLVEKN